MALGFRSSIDGGRNDEHLRCFEKGRRKWVNLDTLYRYSDMLLVLELITPPIDDVVLPGITRQSALELAKLHESGRYTLTGLNEKLVVNERPVTMKEVAAAAEQGTLVEMFGTGMLRHSSSLLLIGHARNCGCC